MSASPRSPFLGLLLGTVTLLGAVGCGGGGGLDPLDDGEWTNPDDDDKDDETSPPDKGGCGANHGGCDSHADCENLGEQVTCTCQQGYTGDGKSCSKAEGACALDNGGCDDHATCSLTAGKASCECADGYEGDGKVCTELDACALDNGGCGAHADCVKTGPGTRDCVCADGYLAEGKACVAPGGLCEAELTPVADDIGAGCGAGSNLPLCAVSSDSCSTGVCVFDKLNSDAYCSAACDGTPETACPNGFVCVEDDCSDGPQYVCARLEVTGMDCMDMRDPDASVTAPNWFGATADGYEYSFVLEPYDSRNEFWVRAQGETEWTTALVIETEATGKVEGAMQESTRLTVGNDTFVAFNRGLFRLSGASVVREDLGDDSTLIAGVFRSKAGKLRAVVIEADKQSVFYDRDAVGVWTRAKATPQPIHYALGALDESGFLARCGADDHLCAASSGDDLYDLPLPEGEVFGGLKERKPLFLGKNDHDFMLITASASVLRRTLSGEFVRDSLPATFSQSLSESDLGRSGFTRAGDQTYLFLSHGTDIAIGGYRLEGDCWQPTNLPQSLVGYGAADGTVRYYLSEAQLLCGVVPE